MEGNCLEMALKRNEGETITEKREMVFNLNDQRGKNESIFDEILLG